MSQQPHLNAPQLLELMENKRYGAEFQPIISMKNGELFGYESLSRFYDKAGGYLPPDLVYASLHSNPLSLFQVEYEQKKIQLSTAPSCENLFVNLDQDSYSASSISDHKNPFVLLFNDYTRANIIVELIENSGISDALMSLSMIDNLSKNNINTAIDDLFCPQSMISTSVIQMVDFMKLDKYVIEQRHCSNFMSLVNAMINYAHETGKKVILEGIETEQDLIFAKQINVDFVQGYLYKKQFINVE